MGLILLIILILLLLGVCPAGAITRMVTDPLASLGRY